jgi:hypothetical protein
MPIRKITKYESKIHAICFLIEVINIRKQNITMLSSETTASVPLWAQCHLSCYKAEMYGESLYMERVYSTANQPSKYPIKISEQFS